MAIELIKFIPNVLRKLSQDNPDRKFLQGELRRARAWELSKSQRVTLEAPEQEMGVKEAKENIRKLVAIVNVKKGGCTLSELQNNRKLRKQYKKIDGKQSVAQLLPTNCVLFAAVMSSLSRHRKAIEQRGPQFTVDYLADPMETFMQHNQLDPIKTKQQLIDLSEKDIDHLKHVGIVKGKIIKAMRDLAIAESKTPQAPR